MPHDTLSTSTLFNTAFHGLNAQTLAELSQVAVQCEYPENIVLCRQGAYEKMFYVVVASR